MTHAEWLSCLDPSQMLSFLPDRATSDRKLRLFAAACCRRLGQLLQTTAERTAVGAVERVADEPSADDQKTAAVTALLQLTSAPAALQEGYAAVRETGVFRRGAYLSVCGALTHDPSGAAAMAARAAAMALADGIEGPAWEAEREAQCGLLRDIFGPLPFRRVTVHPVWLSHTVTALACQMYESREFSPMPILADALQDAGCEDSDILGHCRHPGHVRGCWVVDLVLGMQ